MLTFNVWIQCVMIRITGISIITGICHMIWHHIINKYIFVLGIFIDYFEFKVSCQVCIFRVLETWKSKVISVSVDLCFYFVDGFILEGSRRTSGLRFQFMNLEEDTKDSTLVYIIHSTTVCQQALFNLLSCCLEAIKKILKYFWINAII